MERFPVKTILETKNVDAKCRTNYDVNFNVHLAKGTFGDEKYEISIVVTDRVDISHRLPLNGFNSYCCYNEAETMEKAVVDFCREHDLMICEKVCSWPFAKVSVQPNHFKD